MGRRRILTSFLILMNVLVVLVVILLYYAIRRSDQTDPATGALGLQTLLADMVPPVRDVLNPLLNKPLCPNCNVIFVSLDTLSANHLPCYGYNRDTAPNLCSFGKENIFFDRAYANSYFTLPIHASFFTGLLPDKHKIYIPNISALDPKTPFLPQILQDNGYYTFFNMITGTTHLPIDLVYNRGIDRIVSPHDKENLWQEGIDKLTENSKLNKKTFLFLHTYFVHAPYLINDKPLYTKEKLPNIPTTDDERDACTPDFIQYLKDSIQGNLAQHYWGNKTDRYQWLYDQLVSAADPIRICRDNSDLIGQYRSYYFFNKKSIRTPEQVTYIRDLYDQRINQLDKQLTPLFNLIKSSEFRNNTILIITADHGEEFMEHNEIQHVTLYDSNVRVPLFMYIPGMKNREISRIAQSVDIFPTILELVGIKQSFPIQGESHVGELTGKALGKKYIVAEDMGKKITTIRDDRYKLFVKGTPSGPMPYELYDMSNDAGEKNNVLFTHPSESGQLLDRLLKIVPGK